MISGWGAVIGSCLGLELSQELGPGAKFGDDLGGVRLDDRLHAVVLDILDLDREIADSLAQKRKRALGSANPDQAGRMARAEPRDGLAQLVHRALDDGFGKKRRKDAGDRGADILLDLPQARPDRAFELHILADMEFLPLRFRLFPKGGEFGGVTVRGFDAPGGKAFLASARVSFGEFGRHRLRARRLVGRRRSRRRRRRNRLWRPRAAAGSVVPFGLSAARL